MFNLEVYKNRINVTGQEELTAGSQKVFPVKWTFSSDWNGLTKKIVFTVDTEISTSPLPLMYLYLDEEGMCNIPKEVLDPTWVGKSILAGACGTKGYDTVLPTVWISLGTLKASAVGDSSVLSLQPDLYDELSNNIGNLQNLATQDKSSLVNAINEIVETIKEMM